MCPHLVILMSLSFYHLKVLIETFLHQLHHNSSTDLNIYMLFIALNDETGT